MTDKNHDKYYKEYDKEAQFFQKEISESLNKFNHTMGSDPSH